MSTYYCIRPYYRPWFLWYYPRDYANTKIIRLSIFLITGVCAGFPALLWAVSVLYRHHKSGGRISTIAIFLLLSDLLELILSPVLLTYIIKENYSARPVLTEYIFKDDYAACIAFSLLIGARLCGHQLHQLLALESILIQKYPSLSLFFSPPCSVILCVIVWLVAVGCQFIPSLIINQINICLCVLPVIVCPLTCSVTCKASPDTNQPTDRKPGVLVLSVAMVTLIILYVPFFFGIFTELSFMLDSLASMRLISEPLLCVLICRENRMVETAHTQTDHTQ